MEHHPISKKPTSIFSIQTQASRAASIFSWLRQPSALAEGKHQNNGINVSFNTSHVLQPTKTCTQIFQSTSSEAHELSQCRTHFNFSVLQTFNFQLIIEARKCHASLVILNRIRSFQSEDAKSYEAAKDILDDQDTTSNETVVNKKNEPTAIGSSFLLILAIATGVAAIFTVISIGLKQPSNGSFFGVQFLAEDSPSSVMAAPSVGFTFKAFGYRIVLPEYAPGWIYFWLLMAAGCGLFISEEALNIWVGITLSRMLSLNGTWQSFSSSFSRNAPYIMSTVLWVYWGVCISDMIPFYLGKLFKQSGASDDICSKLGISEEKVLSITGVVQKYGNLAGFVERFSLGVRNPTAFLAGTLGISPECFFAGVCCGGLITLPIQLGIGFLLRERPLFALTTVATVVGIWTVFPYAMAASTALILYLRSRYST